MFDEKRGWVTSLVCRNLMQKFHIKDSDKRKASHGHVFFKSSSWRESCLSGRRGVAYPRSMPCLCDFVQKTYATFSLSSRVSLLHFTFPLLSFWGKRSEGEDVVVLFSRLCVRGVLWLCFSRSVYKDAKMHRPMASRQQILRCIRAPENCSSDKRDEPT